MMFPVHHRRWDCLSPIVVDGRLCGSGDVLCRSIRGTLGLPRTGSPVEFEVGVGLTVELEIVYDTGIR